MSKMRVHELARSLNITSKLVINKLNEQGINVKNHMSSVTAEQAKEISAFFKPESKDNKEEKQKSPTKTDRAKPVKSDKTEGRAVQKTDRPKQRRPFDNTRKPGDKPSVDSQRNRRPKPTGNSQPSHDKNKPTQNKPSDASKPARRSPQSSKPGHSSKRPGKPFQQNQDRTSQGRGKPTYRKPNPNVVKKAPKPEPVELEPKFIEIPLTITVKDFAEKMGVAYNAVIKELMKKGEMISVNEKIDFELASSVAEAFNFLVEEEKIVDLFESHFSEEPDDEKDLVERPPVVVVMGHVDHGKTSLLDSIRNADVIAGEAGGITQHIGAYTVKVKNKSISFLDTPGHEAFTAMRMRGAQVTDIAILVVAADDGVMPQTIEAINHAKAAKVDIIVAINKIDKPNSNVDRVKQELAEHGIVVEDYGGDIVCVPVSAMNNTNIDQLLEMIIITAEMKELKANPNKKARGTVVEALLDKGRGPVATVLVQDGSLNIGDPVVAGNAYGKVRAMTNDKGESVEKAGPSTPVEVLGLSEVPQAGDMFYVAENDKHARQVAEAYVAQGRVELTKSSVQKVSLDDLFNQIQEGSIKDLNIIIKADVQGSAEALKQSLEKLSNEEVRIRIIHGGVGAINESDVMLASTSGAIIIGFNVRPETGAKLVADEQEVDIRLYRVIYSAMEDIQLAMKGMLDPIYEEKIIGHAEIRQIFKASGVGTIGGSYVTDGKITRNAKVRILRDNIVIHEGELQALRRFKDDAKEVSSGYECGISLAKYNDIKENDVVEAYIIQEVER